MKVDGACHCGRVTFEAEIDPDRVRICHCTDCQTLSGSAFRMTAPVGEPEFRLTGGVPKEYVKIAQSGARRIQAFCGECGSPIYATAADGDRRTFGIRVGAIRQRAELVPGRQYWCDSKLQWLPDLPGETFGQQ
jgi:hypothetical protein